MASNEDEIRWLELEIGLELHSIYEVVREGLIHEICQASKRLRALRLDAATIRPNRFEGMYLKREVGRLEASLDLLSIQFIRLHNMRLGLTTAKPDDLSLNYYMLM